ncbi:MAG: hypothetical protein BWK76_04580 [Desulfobulbaceae bacterium A2]|nr:MAG: hypothetical protein BWK76_04580 [Desulfobulbaceae bacterium A2]
MIPMNLRHKMMAGFAVYLVFFSWIMMFFLREFEIFKKDVQLMAHAGRLSNTCLEMRRYEKNYFIGDATADFDAVLGYAQSALDSLPEIIVDLGAGADGNRLQDVETKLRLYRAAFEQYRQEREGCGRMGSPGECASLKEVRGLGQELVRITEELVRDLQERMQKFIHDFTRQLVFYLSMLAVSTISAFYLLYHKVVAPLKSLERAASSIVEGSFRPLPISPFKDEIQSVFLAFNRMAVDLNQHQEQLFQAKKLSSIGTLASGMAHQLNNPLNNISTSCQIALGELEGGDCGFIKRLLHTIDEETRRASQIVKGLLEFSRAQSFSIELKALDRVVARALRLVGSDIPAGITVTSDVSADLYVRIDEQKMLEALLNLLLNAIQAIQEPPGRVTVSAYRNLKEKTVLLSISDSGMGIEQEDLGKIFDPFYTTKGVGKGTGLGLAVVYGIVKKHRGHITVTSVKGKGSTFLVTLPAEDEAPAVNM